MALLLETCPTKLNVVTIIWNVRSLSIPSRSVRRLRNTIRERVLALSNRCGWGLQPTFWSKGIARISRALYLTTCIHSGKGQSCGEEIIQQVLIGIYTQRGSPYRILTILTPAVQKHAMSFSLVLKECLIRTVGLGLRHVRSTVAPESPFRSGLA